MPQLPQDDDTPFSLPRDVPQLMPLDFPDLDSNVDAQEVYDEGLDDVVDVDPYRPDDDPLKASQEIMTLGLASPEYYTTNHYVIRRWVDYRHGRPSRLSGIEDIQPIDSLFIKFEDNEPPTITTPVSWYEFFRIFEQERLAFVFRSHERNGTLSNFYMFRDRDAVPISTEARRVR